MCSATVGATPVKRRTCAASSIFSSGVRGTPSCANTLKRVPELPYAHDGVSMCWVRSAALTAAVSAILLLLVEVENLLQWRDALIGRATTKSFEELRHLVLPAGVHLSLRHPGACPVEVVGF